VADKYKVKALEARRSRGRQICASKKSFPNGDKARAHNKGQLSYECEYCSKFHNRSMRVRKYNPVRNTTLNPRAEKQLSRILHENQKAKHKQWKRRQKTKSK